MKWRLCSASVGALVVLRRTVRVRFRVGDMHFTWRTLFTSSASEVLQSKYFVRDMLRISTHTNYFMYLVLITSFAVDFCIAYKYFKNE